VNEIWLREHVYKKFPASCSPAVNQTSSACVFISLGGTSDDNDDNDKALSSIATVFAREQSPAKL
jgi:hypothetical protein